MKNLLVFKRSDKYRNFLNMNVWEILVSKHNSNAYDYDDYEYKNKFHKMLIIGEYQVGHKPAKWDLSNHKLNEKDSLPKF